MAVIKCRKIGNSHGVVLPGDVLNQLKVQEGDLLSATIVQGAIVLRPVSARTAQVLDSVPALIRQHRDALNEIEE